VKLGVLVARRRMLGGRRCKMLARRFKKRLQHRHFSHARHILNLSCIGDDQGLDAPYPSRMVNGDRQHRAMALALINDPSHWRDRRPPSAARRKPTAHWKVLNQKSAARSEPGERLLWAGGQRGPTPGGTTAPLARGDPGRWSKPP
jgi:hypothetical protein